MNKYLFYIDEHEYELDNSEFIAHLEDSGYKVIGNAVDSLDVVDGGMIEDIIDKFLVSDSFSRQKIYQKVIKNELFHDYNRMDMFDYLEQTGFDFLDNIDSQEMISHLEMVGYKITEE